MPNDQYIIRILTAADHKTAAAPAQNRKTVVFPQVAQVARELQQYYSAPMSFVDPETEELDDRTAVPPNNKFVAKTTSGNKFIHNGKVQAFFVDAPTADKNTILTNEHAHRLRQTFSRKVFM